MEEEKRTGDEEEQTEFENEPSEKYSKTEENKDEEKVFDRSKIREQILEQIKIQASLSTKNRSLQNKLALLKKVIDKDYFQKNDLPKEANEVLFKEVLEKIKVKLDSIKRIQEEKERLVQLLKTEINDKAEKVQESQTEFFEIKRRVSLHAVHSETGGKLIPEEVMKLSRKEEAAWKTLREYQFQSIRKRHSLDEALEEKKKLGEDSFDYAEYEMMCIETENNIESIQKIKEEIEDIRKKSSNAINILSHLTQKLYVEQSEKVRAEAKDKALKDELNSMKNKVFGEKTRYSRLKEKNKELQHKSILLHHPELIEDYNNIQKDSETAKKEVEVLKKKYETAMKTIEGVD